MNERQLKVFLALAETMNFARAARRLHISQPALSLSLKKLEQEVGGALLARTTRQVRLTPEGEALLPRARQLLADWQDTEEMLRHRFTLQRGRVTIAAMPSFAVNVLPGIIAAYRARYTNIDVTILDVVHEEVLELVARGRVELGIGFEPPAEPAFEFVPLFTDRFVAAVPPNSKLSRSRSVNWEQLLVEPFIALQRPSTVRRFLEETLRSQGKRFAVSMECHQLSTVGSLVAAGLGVSAVPALCAGQFKQLGARCIPLHDPNIERPVGLIMYPAFELSVAARALREIVVTMTSRRAAGLAQA
jgi:LysR family transcriptional regulator, carnitine catabolism transcriptional activator